MAAVIMFFDPCDPTERPNNLTETHVFEDEHEAIEFSIANLDRPHLIKRVDPENWHAKGYKDKKEVIELGPEHFPPAGSKVTN
jgi:hypothetical protein